MEETALGMSVARIVLPAFIVACLVICAVVVVDDPQVVEHVSAWLQGVADGANALIDALGG